MVNGLVPSVTALIKTFNLPEHTAGATLLMLFLNIPEILINSVSEDRSETTLFLSEVMSSSLVFKALAGGVINIMYPRSTFPPFFIRDSVFNIIGFIPFYIAIWNKKASIDQGILCVLVYVVFFIVALIQNNYYSNYYKFLTTKINLHDVQKSVEMKEQITPLSVKTHYTRGVSYNQKDMIFIVINPLHRLKIEHECLVIKIADYITCPLTTALSFFIPVVNVSLPNKGFSIVMTVVHLTFCPFLLMMIPKEFTTSEKCYLFIPSGCLMLFLIICPPKSGPPKYQILFSGLGMAATILVLYYFVMEVRATLYLLSNLCGLSSAFIGMTILSFANRVQEMVIVISLVNQGNINSAYTCCDMFPLVGGVFAVGVYIIINNLKDNSNFYVLREGAMGSTGLVFNVVLEIFLTVGISVSNFAIRRSIGIFALIIYILFLTFVIFIEFNIMHGLGTDHYAHLEKFEADWA
ncbi:SLC8B1.2 family protein [Megaselia abdita]